MTAIRIDDFTAAESRLLRILSPTDRKAVLLESAFRRATEHSRATHEERMRGSRMQDAKSIFFALPTEEYHLNYGVEITYFRGVTKVEKHEHYKAFIVFRGEEFRKHVGEFAAPNAFCEAWQHYEANGGKNLYKTADGSSLFFFSWDVINNDILICPHLYDDEKGNPPREYAAGTAPAKRNESTE